MFGKRDNPGRLVGRAMAAAASADFPEAEALLREACRRAAEEERVRLAEGTYAGGWARLLLARLAGRSSELARYQSSREATRRYPNVGTWDAQRQELARLAAFSPIGPVDADLTIDAVALLLTAARTSASAEIGVRALTLSAQGLASLGELEASGLQLPPTLRGAKEKGRALMGYMFFLADESGGGKPEVRLIANRLGDEFAYAFELTAEANTATPDWSSLQGDELSRALRTWALRGPSDEELDLRMIEAGETFKANFAFIERNVM